MDADAIRQARAITGRRQVADSPVSASADSVTVVFSQPASDAGSTGQVTSLTGHEQVLDNTPVVSRDTSPATVSQPVDDAASASGELPTAAASRTLVGQRTPDVTGVSRTEAVTIASKLVEMSQQLLPSLPFA